ncbi:hypothetical protein [Mesorhizobium comanense]|uniref:hypothetical protein n=1 Tax=Mesorhizobium comanense TaxID=2502215 RepID=UPI0010F637A8|nr:hypothetical protein [Mesorhizobium comanense]
MGLIEDEQAAKAEDASAGKSAGQGSHAAAADAYGKAARLWRRVADQYATDAKSAEQAGNAAEACRCRCAAADAFEAAARAYMAAAAEFLAVGHQQDASGMEANAVADYDAAAPLFEACGACQSGAGKHARAWVAYSHARACWTVVRVRSAAAAQEMRKRSDEGTEEQKDEFWEAYKLERARKEKAAKGEARAKTAETDERDRTRE